MPEGLPAKEPEGLSVTAAVSPAMAATTPPPVDLEELAASQASCEDCSSAKSLPALLVLAVKLAKEMLLVDASSGSCAGGV
jgi:hypothetical protein